MSTLAPDRPARGIPPALPWRDTLIMLGSLAGLTALAWAYLLHLSAAMASMTAMVGMSAKAQPWTPIDYVFGFVMWSVMMVGMMLPSASPMVLLVARFQRGSHGRTAMFLLGYLLVWVLFSAVATLLQGGLQTLRLLSATGITEPLLVGAVLLGVGVYQWTSVKQRCLEKCQSPIGFVMSHWRPGAMGALRLGWSHGWYCLGCCWLLMLLLFAVGVMNLLWVAGLAMLVLLEKVVPAGPWLARTVGTAIILWGALLLTGQA